MRKEIMGIFICSMILVSIFGLMTQNIGLIIKNTSGAEGLADSPWPMFCQNLNHTGISPYDTSSNLGYQKWNFTTGDHVHSMAIGSGDMLYVGSYDGKLYSIYPNGTQRWNYTTGDSIESSPAIDSDGTIYVGSRDNKFYAINPNGTQKWNFITGDWVDSSPAISSDGTIYIGSHDKKLYAINSNGTQKWNFTTGSIVDSSPAISIDGTIYVGSLDKKLYAINPNGTQKWNFTTGGGVDSSPSIGSDGTIYVGSNDNVLYAINPNGTEKWNFTTEGSIQHSSPAISAHGTIYIGSFDGILYAINPNGTQKWNFTVGNNVYSSSTISDDGTIYIGSFYNKLYAINPNGTQKWNFTTDSIVWATPIIGSDGTIYVGSCNGIVYAIGNMLTDIPPNANAGGDQIVEIGNVVDFDGSGSTDNIGIDKYVWTFTYNNLHIELLGMNPQFRFDYLGDYVISLNVSDAAGNWDTGIMNLVVQETEPPLPDAGPDQDIMAGQIAHLNGSLSTDNSGVIDNYTWAFTHNGNAITLYGAETDFKFEKAGLYEVTLTVWDPSNNYASDSMRVNVTTSESEERDIEPDDEERFYIPWWIFLILAIVIIILFIVLYLKKDGETESEEMPKTEQDNSLKSKQP